MGIKGYKKYILFLIAILIATYPVVTGVAAFGAAEGVVFKLPKTDFLPLESFSLTVENIPENEITSLILIPSKSTSTYQTSLVYCFQGNDRSVLNLCSPGIAGTYQFILIRGSVDRDNKPVVLSKSPEFKVCATNPSAEEAKYKELDPYDVLIRQGMSDFGPIQLYHDGYRIKGFSPWNNMNLTGKVRKAKGKNSGIICADLEWVTYTPNGVAHQKGNMVLNITVDGEKMYGRYRTGNSGYWTKMESYWYWWTEYALKDNSIIFCKEDSAIRLLWNPITLTGNLVGYNVYTADGKGIISKEPINRKPVQETCFSIKTINKSQNYIIRAINRDGSQVPVTQLTNLGKIYNCPLTAYGHDLVHTSAKMENNEIKVEPYDIISALISEYNTLFQEKHPEQAENVPESYKIVEAPKGNILTMSYKKRSLVIKHGSKYYEVNGKKKSWGYIMKKIEDKDGYSYFTVPLSVISEALGFKAEKEANGNLINISIGL